MLDRIVSGLVHEQDRFRDPLGLRPGTMSVFRAEAPSLGKVMMAETDDGCRQIGVTAECITKEPDVGLAGDREEGVVMGETTLEKWHCGGQKLISGGVEEESVDET